MAEFPSLPLWTDALLADCHHLTDAEFGRYMRLLILLWRSPDCRVPNDDEWLARRLCRSVEEIISDWRPLIEEFCKNSGNFLTQKRLRREFSYIKDRREKQSARAKARWEKEKDPCRGSTASGNAASLVRSAHQR